MSYTTVKAIYPGERTESIEELRNSHGSAVPVWAAMAGKYLGVTKSYDYPKPGYMQLGQELWDLWRREDVPLHHRAVFMMTFDRAYVPREKYAQAAADIRRFLADFLIPTDHANHWPRIAEIFESNPDVPGIGFHITSVSDDPFQGAWNEEKEDYDQPDWSQVYDLYAELAGVSQ